MAQSLGLWGGTCILLALVFLQWLMRRQCGGVLVEVVVLSAERKEMGFLPSCTLQYEVI